MSLMVSALAMSPKPYIARRTTDRISMTFLPKMNTTPEGVVQARSFGPRRNQSLQPMAVRSLMLPRGFTAESRRAGGLGVRVAMLNETIRKVG